VISNEEPSCNIDRTVVWKLVRRHHLETILLELTKTNPTVPEDIKLRISNIFNQMVARKVQQWYCLDRIEKVLDDAGIQYAP